MINGPATQIVVTFSKPLVPDPAIDHTNWIATWNTFPWVPTAAAVVGSTVVIDGAQGVGPPGDNIISYLPPPFDVITVDDDLPVLLFVDFNLTA